MMEIIHGTHLGIVKCKQRARETLYWPGMSAQIEDKVKNCTMCRPCAAERASDTKSCPRPALGNGRLRHICL